MSKSLYRTAAFGPAWAGRLANSAAFLSSGGWVAAAEVTDPDGNGTGTAGATIAFPAGYQGPEGWCADRTAAGGARTYAVTEMNPDFGTQPATLDANGLPGVNTVDVAGQPAQVTAGNPDVNLVSVGGTAVTGGKVAATLAASDVTGALPANVTQFAGHAAATDANGLPSVNTVDVAGAPAQVSSGNPDVNLVSVGGTAVTGGKVPATVAANDGADSAAGLALLLGLVDSTDHAQLTGHALANAPTGSGGTGGASLAEIQGELDTRGLTSTFTTLAATNLDAKVSSLSTYAGADTPGTATLLTRITGTVAPQSGDAFARLGAPAGASLAADVAAVKAGEDAIKVKTDALPPAYPAVDGSGRVAVNLSQPLAPRNQDANTAPTVGDALQGAWTEAFGGESEDDANHRYTKRMPDGTTAARTFTTTPDANGNPVART